MRLVEADRDVGERGLSGEELLIHLDLILHEVLPVLIRRIDELLEQVHQVGRLAEQVLVAVSDPEEAEAGVVDVDEQRALDALSSALSGTVTVRLDALSERLPHLDGGKEPGLQRAVRVLPAQALEPRL